MNTRSVIGRRVVKIEHERVKVGPDRTDVVTVVARVVLDNGVALVPVVRLEDGSPVAPDLRRVSHPEGKRKCR